ncbi:DUF935 domain-containing protein [Vibrio sp. LaRot3]|uniref:DUF935 domain-containing protein n=1 Tax=Vibrio sp. LaRot3 TaxID=2998829 RepID=UPI0022CE0C26|nr:DUF935 domain-containing protein [Vibrio sp. LaRot3]MDA0148845.1 DUF935 domain-containing protein [Vibrio sp. LaRot3]
MNSPIINPNTNKPFTKEEREQITQHQSKAHVMSVRKPLEWRSIASGLTPAKLATTLRSALQGQPEDYFLLAEEMEERDTHYRAVLSTRKLAVASIEPVVEAASDDKQHIAHADAIREILRHPEVPELMMDLLDGIGKGISLVEQIWDTNSKPYAWVPKEYEWVSPVHIQIDMDDLHTVRLKSDDETLKGEPLKPNGYIIHKPRMKSGHWIRNGLARVVAVMYMLKSYTVKDWWAFAEVFGMPVRIGKYHSNASEDDIRTLVNAIASIASDAGAAIPESMQIDMIDTAKGNGGDTLFENMAKWADQQISKAVLGQTMTTDDGSSQSQATVHNEVRKDIINWDARQLANTLNRDLVKRFIDFNFGPQERYPEIKLTIEETEDLKAWVEALTPLIDRGLKVQASDVRDKMGLADPEQGAELLHPEHQVPHEQDLALNHRSAPFKPRLTLAMNAKRSADELVSDDEINEFVLEALDDWQEVSAPILNPILELAEQVDSFEAFAEQLPRIAEQMDDGAFIEQLTKLCWQSRALGDVSDE